MFETKFGDIPTTTPWVTPTYDLLKKWYDEFTSITDISNLKLELVGAFAEQLNNPPIKTKDIDISVTSDEYPDLKQLRDVLLNGLVVGLNNNIFVDIFWQNKEMDFFHKNLNNIDASTIDKTKLKTIRNYYIFEQKINQSTYTVDLSKECEIVYLPFGLYELSGFRKNTIQKVLNRHKNYIYKRTRYELSHIF